MTEITNANFYAPEELTSLTVAGATLSDGTVLFDDIAVSGTYAGPLPAAPTFTASGNYVVSDSTGAAALNLTYVFMIFDGFTSSGAAAATAISGSTVGIVGGTWQNATAGAVNLSTGELFITTRPGAGGISVGAVFSGNSTSAGGGAIYSAGTLKVYGATFSENRSNASSGVAGGGAIAVINTSAVTVIAESTFTNNLAPNRWGGAVLLQGTVTICDSVFSGNSASFGGAVAADSSSVTIRDTTFTGNSAARGGAIWVRRQKCTVTLKGNVYFVTGTDTVYVGGSATLNINQANVRLNADLYAESAGKINMSDSALIFGNTTAINVSGLTLSGTDAMTFNGSEAVNFTNQNLSGVAITVGTGNLPGRNETFTIATGIAAMDSTITVNGQSADLGDDVVIGGDTYTFAFDNGNFTVSQEFMTYDTVAVAPAGTTGVVICGETIALEHRYDTLAAAVEHLNAGGTLILADQSYPAGSATSSQAGTTLIADVTTDTSGNITFYGNTAKKYTGDVTIKLDRVTHTADKIFLDNKGTVRGNWNATVNDSFSENLPNARGYFYLAAGSITGNANINVSASHLTAIYASKNGTVINGELNLTVTGTTLDDGIYMTATVGAGNICSGVNYTITDSYIAGIVYGGGGNATSVIDGDIDIAITGSTVAGGIIGSNANAVAADRTIRVTLTGSTVGSVAKYGSGGAETVLAGMTVNISGATNSVIGSLTDVDDLVIGAGARADFTTAQNLSAVALTVDGSQFSGSDLVVATGVTAVGGYDITNAAASTFLKAVNGELVMYTRAADVADGMTLSGYTGTDSNLMTGGSIGGAFFGTDATGGSVRTVITGGEIGNAVVGGAKVKGGTAALGTVTLNIAGGEIVGGTANGGMLYTAGYAYGLTGGTTTDVAPTLTVAKSILNLKGGSITAQNLFAGAHARAGAYAVADETVITVTGGTYGRIYGGGWAEKYGKSEVGSSSITVSGGRVEYIYAGGANAANGKTYVNGDVDIQFTGGTVDFVFLAGKNKNCSVTGSVSLTLSGAAKKLIRISGHNANGSDNTSGITSLTVETNTTVGYLDYVDKINLTQGTLLDITTLVQYEHGTDTTLNFLTDGRSGDWTALSGAGFEIFQSAHFQVNGTEYTRNADTGVLGESGYKLDFNEDKFIISKLA